MTQASLLDALESPEELRADLRTSPRFWTITYVDGARTFVRVIRIERGVRPGLQGIEDVTDKVARVCELGTIRGRILAVTGGILPHHQMRMHLNHALGKETEVFEL